MSMISTGWPTFGLPNRKRWLIPAALVLVLLATPLATTPTANAANSKNGTGKVDPGANVRWATTWEAAMLQNGLQNYISDTTRTRIRTSAGGEAVRVRFSNVFGSATMRIDSANVALPDTTSSDPSAIVPSTIHTLTFNNGQTFAEVPAGQELLSDPIAMTVPKLSDLMITMHFNGLTQYADGHSDNVTPLPGLYVVRNQDVSSAASFAKVAPGFETYNGVFNLSEVEVQVPAKTRVIIAMSESITDGRGAVGIQHPWPAVLSQLANAGDTVVGVGNAGIGGNSMFDTYNAGPGCCGVALIDRFQRDVLSRNPTDIVLLAGDNDLSRPYTAEDIIQRYQWFIDVAHANHIKVYGGVNTPIGDIIDSHGNTVSTGFYSVANEAKRQQINTWIQASGYFDGVIDFSAVVGNPLRTPLGIATACYDPESPIHMNNQGYDVMGTLAYDVMFGKSNKPASPCNASPFPPAN